MLQNNYINYCRFYCRRIIAVTTLITSGQSNTDQDYNIIWGQYSDRDTFHTLTTIYKEKINSFHNFFLCLQAK